MKLEKEDVVVLIAVSIFFIVVLAAAFAPCKMYSIASQKDVPARCVSYFNSVNE